MRPDDRIRLQHMVEAAEAVFQVIDNRTCQDLDTDLMLRLAVVRAVEIPGILPSLRDALGRSANGQP